MRSYTLLFFVLLAACSSSQKVTEAPPATNSGTEAPEAEAESKPHHAHHSMQHRFDDAERWAKVFDAPERDAWQMPRHVIELMNIEPGSTVADIGAGTGYFMPYLSEAVGADGRVFALDIEPTLVEHMTKRAAEAGLTNVTASVIQPDDPALEPGGFQRVLIVDTWHHISDREAYATKIAAGLAPGGALYVVDFTMETERGPSKPHRLASDVVIAELGAAGLEAKLVEETLPDQYVVVGVRP